MQHEQQIIQELQKLEQQHRKLMRELAFIKQTKNVTPTKGQ